MTPTNPAFKYNSVMLIDDNPIDNFINERIIRNCFFSKNVLVHTNVSSALEYFKNFKQMENIPSIFIPKCIFLDINMPMMDGWVFLKEYEKLNLSFDCKIVILSASVNPDDTKRAKEFKKVEGYFCKPLNGSVLGSL